MALKLNHTLLYWISTIFIVVGLPLSNALMSIGVIALLVTWLIEGNLSFKLKRFTKHKLAVLCVVLFGIHVLGLLYTTDLAWALKDIRIKLPLLILPLVYSSFQGFTQKQVKQLMYWFIGSVTVSTILSFLVYQHVLFPERYINDPRSIAIFISHIRLSLMISLSIMSLVYLFYKNHTNLKPLYVLLIFWLIGFLYILQSFTGFTTLILGGVILLIVYVFRLKENYLKWLCLVFAVGLGTGAFLYVKDVVDEFDIVHEDLNRLEAYSPHGEKYVHDDNDQMENGYYIYKNIAIKELVTAWNERSDVSFFDYDAKGFRISGTLFRYLTSKGLHKDRYGVYQLTTQDLKNIENGIANIEHVNGGLRTRVKKSVFQLNKYFKYNDPRGSSIAQRMEYWQTGLTIVESHFLIGVGTGDAKQNFNEVYCATNTKLLPQNWNRAHNQFLTFLITFGIIGLLLFITLLITAIVYNRSNLDFYFLAFYAIVMLSFLWEDTLETQPGVTFFAFFFTLFLMARRPSKPIKHTTHSLSDSEFE